MRRNLAQGVAAARLALRRAAWRSRWLELSALVIITVVLASCLHRRWDEPPMLAPLLAVPPALAGIGAVTVRRPLAYGGVSLLAAVFVAVRPTEFAAWLPAVTMVTTVLITAVATLGTAFSVRQERRIATVRSVAEVAQHALLRPPPERLGGVGFDVAYLAAAAEATVGGDLYEVTRTAEHGIRVIMGDVRGKGLDAVELAADILGMFRELAHDASTLGDLAARLDTGLGRSLGRYEEFVTALLLEIDQESGQASIFSCGHPPPLLISAPAGDSAPGSTRPASVSTLQVPVPAPPLGLLALGDRSAAQLSFYLRPEDQLLLYTDGVTEARDARRRFYPLSHRAALAAKTAARAQALNGGARPGLLGLLRADLLQHVGAPLNDDAALLLIQAPAAWPASLAGRASQDRGSQSACSA